jgi:secreted trypsin-like serine protease
MAVTKVVSHPDYFKGGELINDVALLRLAEPVAAEHTVRYPSKGNTQFERAGQPVTIVGWGATDPMAENYPNRAREAKAQVVGDKECKKAWRGITAEIVCAGAPLRDICEGDSGGPLLVDTRNGWVQIGALSFRDEPCGDGLPAGYARLSAPIIANFVAKTIAEQSAAQR